jgi:hypothetical protein
VHGDENHPISFLPQIYKKCTVQCLNCVCTHVHVMCICMYVCMYVCVCIYIYIHTYIHIYIYIYIGMFQNTVLDSHDDWNSVITLVLNSD